MKKTYKLNESQLNHLISKMVKESLGKLMEDENEEDLFEFTNLIDMGSKTRQVINYKGNPIGYVLMYYNEYNEPIDRTYFLPEDKFNMTKFKYEKEAMLYAKENYGELVRLFKYFQKLDRYK